MRHRRLLASIGTAGLLAGGGLALATPAPALASSVGTCWSMDYAPGETGMCDQSYNQFSEAAAIHTTPGGAVTGTGAASDLFYATDFQQVATAYRCDNGVTTRYWYYGTDQNTGTSGWVADCYLNYQGP